MNEMYGVGSYSPWLSVARLMIYKNERDCPTEDYSRKWGMDTHDQAYQNVASTL